MSCFSSAVSFAALHFPVHQRRKRKTGSEGEGVHSALRFLLADRRRSERASERAASYLCGQPHVMGKPRKTSLLLRLVRQVLHLRMLRANKSKEEEEERSLPSVVEAIRRLFRVRSSDCDAMARAVCSPTRQTMHRIRSWIHRARQIHPCGTQTSTPGISSVFRDSVIYVRPMTAVL